MFVDRGAVWSHDQRLADADWKQGYGAGVFAIATVFQFRLDVAHGQGRGTRAHVSARTVVLSVRPAPRAPVGRLAAPTACAAWPWPCATALMSRT